VQAIFLPVAANVSLDDRGGVANVTTTMRTNRTALLAATLAGALLSLPQVSLAAASGPGAPAQAQTNGPGSDAAARLNKKQFRNVTVSVDNGIATLSGTVDLFEYRADAEKTIRKARGVTGVRNEIQIAGPNVSDSQLQAKLLKKLTYDRVGYGNTFNAISLNVENGVVTLAGRARTDVDKDSALALVSYYPGVKDVVAHIQVDPVSIMDDHSRMAVARAVYSSPMLSKYAIDPAQPIRISVQNGNVELYGVVDNQTDKEVAFIRANAVPGIFSVKNYLQVANQPVEGQGQNKVVTQ
jgi:osmotically-inducible protein OsmY